MNRGRVREPVAATPRLVELWAELAESLPANMAIAEAWECNGACGESAHFIIRDGVVEAAR